MRKLGPISVLVSAMLASTAYAQAPTDAPSAPPGASDAGVQPGAEADAGEIVVTAQRRSENLQDTTLAVTAVTAAAVQNLGLTEIRDIAAITPGASFTTNNNFFSPFIRGIGTQYTSVGFEAPVAVYEDGAYLPRTLAVNEIIENFDIGSIQVLRGPQGTLYGRNATGGVIIINSADPTNKFEGRVRGEFGNLERRTLNGMINVPLGEDLALRVSGGYKHEGDYVFSITPGDEDRGGGRVYSARGKLRWSPEGADIILGGEYIHSSYRAGLNTLGRNDNTCYACTLFPGTVPADLDFYDFTGRLTRSPLRSEFLGGNLSMTFDMGDIDLSSVTTYRRQRTIDSVGDQDQTPALFFEFTVPTSGGETYSQDLQITSKLSGPFNYIVGLSYLNDKGYFNPCFLGDAFGGFTSAETGGCFTNTVKTISYASFAEANYQLTDELKVTVGGRYTYETRSLNGSTNAVLGTLFGAGGAFSFTQKRSERAFTPRFVLSYDNGPTNIYYSYTRGFKSGGFPGPAVFPVTPFDAEKIGSHEIGIKHAMFDNRVRLNLATFYYKNKNQQVQTLDPLTSVSTVRNSGALENYGVEFEAQIRPVDGLNIGLNAAWQHARYKPFRNAALICFDPTGTLNPTAPGATLYPCFQDATGARPPQTPTWSGSVNASYEFAIGDWTAQLAGIAQYRSSIDYFVLAGGDLGYDRDDERILVNTSGYISPPGGSLRIGYYVNNLFDKEYAAYRQTASPYGTSYNAARPRTYGLRVEYAF